MSKLGKQPSQKGLPVSSCSLVNEYEILTQGWSHRCSGKQSHFKPVNCPEPEARWVGEGESPLPVPLYLSPEPQDKLGHWILPFLPFSSGGGGSEIKTKEHICSPSSFLTLQDRDKLSPKVWQLR